MFQNQRYHHHHPHPHRHPHAVRALDPACNRRLQCQGPHINLDEFVGRIRIVRPKPMKICFKTKTTAMWEQQCHKPPIWEWSMPPTKMVIWGWFIVLPTLAGTIISKRINNQEWATNRLTQFFTSIELTIKKTDIWDLFSQYKNTKKKRSSIPKDGSDWKKKSLDKARSWSMISGPVPATKKGQPG